MFVEIEGQYVNLNYVKKIQFSTGFDRTVNPPAMKYFAKATVIFILAGEDDIVIKHPVENADDTAEALEKLKQKIRGICNDRRIFFGVIS